MNLTIAAGPLAIAISCDSAPLAEALRRRYGPFLAEAPPWIAVEVVLETPGQRPETVVADGPRAELTGANMAAQIDLISERARLVAAPEAAADAVEQLLRVTCALLAIDGGGLLVHGAAIAAGPRGYLFLGPSGAGKTTVARNAAGRRVLNDDLALLWPAEEGWDIWATPFTNPTQVAPGGPDQARLTALFHLVQSPTVARTPMGKAIATAALAARAPIVGTDPARASHLLQRCRTICYTVSSDYLQLRADPDFWQIVDPVS